jgi:hypothetical protein
MLNHGMAAGLNVTLSYAISSFCPTSADGLQSASHWLWSEAAYFVHLNLLSYLKP